MKNKLLLLVFGSALCLSIFSFGCVKREIANLGSKGKNIICFGDSITFGYGVNPGEDYPTALANLAPQSVINSGVDGDTTFDGLKRIDADALQKDPYLVIVEFSGNDFLKKIPKEDTFKNIAKMIDKVQAAGAIAAIADVSAGMFFRDYRVGLSRLAQEKKAIFIPSLLKGIITTPNLKSDFLHPNAEGYKVIARRVHDGIKPYLKENKAE